MTNHWLLQIAGCFLLVSTAYSAEEPAAPPTNDAAEQIEAVKQRADQVIQDAEAKMKAAQAEADAKAAAVIAKVEAEAKAEAEKIKAAVKDPDGKGLADLRAKAAAARKKAEAKTAKIDQAQAQRQGKALQNAVQGFFEQVIGQFQPVPAQADAAAGEMIILNMGPVAPAEQPAENGELNPAEQQMLTQLQPLLNLEVVFARQACGLNKQQSKELAAAGKEDLKSVAKAYLKWQNQPRHIVRNNVVQRITPQPLDPRDKIRKSLAATIKAKFPEAVSQQYAQELAKRAEFEKQVALENLVATIDERLMLDNQQREKLIEVLAKHWDPTWVPQLQTFVYANNYFPPVPKQHIVPLLRESQQDVWKAAVKNAENNGFVHWGGFGLFNFGMPQMAIDIEE